MEMDSEQYFVRVNSSCARLNSTIGWGGGIYFFNLDFNNSDCGNIEILSILWYDTNTMISFDLMRLSICLNLLMNNESVLR